MPTEQEERPVKMLVDGKSGTQEYVPLTDAEWEDHKARQRDAIPMDIERHKSMRNALLRDCDWTQLPDSPLTPEESNQWQKHRQELRDYHCRDSQFPKSPKEIT